MRTFVTTYENLDYENLNYKSLGCENLDFGNLVYENLGYKNLDHENLGHENLGNMTNGICILHITHTPFQIQRGPLNFIKLRNLATEKLGRKKFSKYKMSGLMSM